MTRLDGGFVFAVERKSRPRSPGRGATAGPSGASGEGTSRRRTNRGRPESPRIEVREDTVYCQ
jgi:hypothetical protein